MIGFETKVTKAQYQSLWPLKYFFCYFSVLSNYKLWLLLVCVSTWLKFFKDKHVSVVNSVSFLVQSDLMMYVTVYVVVELCCCLGLSCHL